LSMDGMNPFNMVSNNQSTWPMRLRINNLLPWLCMKRTVTTRVCYNLGLQFWSPTKLWDEPYRLLDSTENTNTLLFYPTRKLATWKSKASAIVKHSPQKMHHFGSDY
jgi:hypothetical protein